MKKILVLMVMFLLIAGTSFAATIVGSDHDMRQHITDEPADAEVCLYCHYPHNADTTAAPLWNKSYTGSVFSPYTSTTLNGTVDLTGTNVTRACMTCHDGTLSVAQVTFPAVSPPVGTTGDGVVLGIGTLQIISAAGNLGTDLSNDHPVGVTYLSSGVGSDPALRAETGSQVAGPTITVQLFGAASPYTVECASCHDVHDPTYTPFLVGDNTGSDLCLTCHLK